MKKYITALALVCVLTLTALFSACVARKEDSLSVTLYYSFDVSKKDGLVTFTRTTNPDDEITLHGEIKKTLSENTLPLIYSLYAGFAKESASLSFSQFCKVGESLHLELSTPSVILYSEDSEFDIEADDQNSWMSYDFDTDIESNEGVRSGLEATKTILDTVGKVPLIYKLVCNAADDVEIEENFRATLAITPAYFTYDISATEE